MTSNVATGMDLDDPDTEMTDANPSTATYSYITLLPLPERSSYSSRSSQEASLALIDAPDVGNILSLVNLPALAPKASAAAPSPPATKSSTERSLSEGSKMPDEVGAAKPKAKAVSIQDIMNPIASAAPSKSLAMSIKSPAGSAAAPTVPPSFGERSLSGGSRLPGNVNVVIGSRSSVPSIQVVDWDKWQKAREAEEEAKRKVEEEAKRKDEEEEKRKAKEEARRKVEEEAKRKAREEAKRESEKESEKMEESEEEENIDGSEISSFIPEDFEVPSFKPQNQRDGFSGPPGPWAREKRLREILKPAKRNWANREYKVDEMVRVTIAKRYRWT
ncbi:hypothetical protein FPQ18DRAFT_393653 [Pyronema domesticum]|uniref:Uncharacterized protein n=1 Tax=Pyronema omphalodes (strain CBS 100304) TaxID=1076935 RepID=U4L9S3_PYROM|nr:hypothetical protein FPQ18DRAFT_393653 [Pyronema domesticum]CCX15923.1 Protein of unknown function [Pyronema omphalodes CBS 100304]